MADLSLSAGPWGQHVRQLRPRLLVPLAVTALAFVVAIGGGLYFATATETARRGLRPMQARLDEASNAVRRLIELDRGAADAEARWQHVRRRGLIGRQDRDAAVEALRRLVAERGLTQLTYEVAAPKRYQLSPLEDETLVAQASSTILRLQLQAPDDRAVFALATTIQERLPGEVIVREIQIDRGTPSLDPLIQHGETAGLKALVSATLVLDWTQLEIERGDAGGG